MMKKPKFCKKLWLNYQISKYEKILEEEGMKQAFERGETILVGLEDRLIPSGKSKNSKTIYLPKNEKGQTDISPILYIGAENKPEEAKKYIVYEKMLERLNR